ncbi:hypothetical protein L596_014371 [Steinernema carpocapsae]|uniref:Uncharacterized protein n=1 Tax=Steinernema carpocapsae TaxID=34508 RepID=A0A4U5NCI9_STECR|nr:hypothetical protein L596_014371 [Steinernema carpocapsae]
MFACFRINRSALFVPNLSLGSDSLVFHLWLIENPLDVSQVPRYLGSPLDQKSIFFCDPVCSLTSSNISSLVFVSFFVSLALEVVLKS